MFYVVLLFGLQIREFYSVSGIYLNKDVLWYFISFNSIFFLGYYSKFDWLQINFFLFDKQFLGNLGIYIV